MTLRSCLRPLLARLAAFRDDVRGSLTLETALMMPMLAFFYVATFVWFDAFRAQNTSLKATYAIADMISRETVPLSEDYMNGLNTVFDYMTYSPAPTQLRITTAKCTADCEDDGARKLEVCWSWSTADVPDHTAASFSKIEGAIPLMVLGDTIVITETFMAYAPAFKVIASDTVLSHLTVTRPRFAPQIALETEKCY